MNSRPSIESVNQTPYPGQRWLVEERDACGVGFIANLKGEATHELMEKSLHALACLEHRGGCSADQDSGDGAGLMTAIPWDLIGQFLAETGVTPPPLAQIGVGMVFLPHDEAKVAESKAVVAKVLQETDFQLLGWRKVPVQPLVLGVQARENCPVIEQLIVASSGLTGDELERQLYLLRRQIGRTLETETALRWSDDCYICSFSSRTLVYKGMVRSAVLGEFYTDLKNPDYKSQFSVYHRRFSTNTMPKWPLAQPMRFLGHNGEINTLLGNINGMMAREAALEHPIWGEEMRHLKPTTDIHNSDSATLDNVLELLVQTGRSPLEAIAIMVPEAYSKSVDLAEHPEIVDFYEYYSGVQEPWDGPALIVLSDGKVVGATLDRNGLRPARYSITRDGYAIVASEAGVVDVDPAMVLEKGRLGPGQMIAVNLETNQVLSNIEIKSTIASALPYGEWLAQHRTCLTQQPFEAVAEGEVSDLLRSQIAFGYSTEDVEMVITEMASAGKEPTFCMGDDIPLAVLSEKAHPIYDYFKQRFAQVTNPPIDPLRENLVMSLSVYLGDRGNLLQPAPESARLIKLDSPVLNEGSLDWIRNSSPFKTTTLNTLVDVAAGPDGLGIAVGAICEAAAQAVKEGTEVLVLSDRQPLTADLTYIPPMVAVGAVHHHLIRAGLRSRVSLVVETAQCWSTHHYACLIGYGASAVCPYLALNTVRHWWGSDRTQNLMKHGKLETLTVEQAQANYCKAVEGGLFKILSKMGISLLSSYQGAQIFEALGIGPDLVELAFRGTASRIGGLTVRELANEVLSFHGRAFPELTVKKLENFGFVQYRPGGEYHMNSPETAKALHKAVRDPKPDHYALYQTLIQNRPVTALRDLLDFQVLPTPIPLEEVESVESIMARFCTGGMSLGALSREAHETLAIAMNRIGGKSNSGEGGEDPIRYKRLDDVDASGLSPTFPHLKGLRNDDTASSAIKQVASGRFGVTPGYLASARQIEIKMAQGAKPGEGGQLPGKKVSPYIAMLRRSKPGVTLISPPPHHDIYSIEDLAQLIYDLHSINPKAQVSVKLVAEVGIGTIAAGVAKANADIIQISGHDGGTGASPLSSIKHAGSPWELGLTEVHRVLLENQLRDRVILRVDGGLKTGYDVVMAALMGAEEFGFGSIAMIAEGCIMARICHTNNCPVGVASQQEKLRERFPGTPEQVVNFFYYVAEEVRSLLARLGLKSLSEVVGRSDLLQYRPGAKLAKTGQLNLDCLLNLPDTRTERSWLNHEAVHGNGDMLDDQLLANPDIVQALAIQGSVTQDVAVVNTDRTVGTRLAGAIAGQYGDSGWTGQITLNFSGSVGQSFGAFILPGMTLNLEGEANDYVGKGMHGGEIVVKPAPGTTFDPSQNVIIGNTCLYGATGGSLYALGLAGERFAVRNSKATAVIEGAGDHCCEYMTGGTLVVLGKVGRNCCAGMTGGLAYFLDEAGDFPLRLNPEIVKLQRVVAPAGVEQLKTLIELHHQKTGSQKAKQILEQWSEYLPKFWQAVPPSEADSPEANPDGVQEKVLSLS